MKNTILACVILILLSSCGNVPTSPVHLQSNKDFRIVKFFPEAVYPDTIVCIAYLNKTNEKPEFFIGDLKVQPQWTEQYIDTLASYFKIDNSVKTGRISIKTSQYTDTSDKPLIILKHTLSLYDFEPKTGDAGTIVTIKATLPPNYDLNQVSVWFGNLKSNVMNIINSGALNLIVAKVPDSVYTSRITVKSGTESVVSQDDFVVLNPPPPDNRPKIKEFTPKFGGWNSEITLKGINFGTQIGDSKVFLGDVECPVKSLTNYEIKVTLPFDAKSGKFSVINKTAADTAKDIFNYQFISKVGIEVKGIKYKAIHTDYTLTMPIDTTYPDAAFNFAARQFNMQPGSQDNEFIYSIKLDSGSINLNHHHIDSIFIKLNYNDQISQIQNFTFYTSHYYYPFNPKSFSSNFDWAFLSMKPIALKSSDNNSWTFEVSGNEINNLMDKFDAFSEKDFHETGTQYRQVITKFLTTGQMDNSSSVRVILYR